MTRRIGALRTSCLVPLAACFVALVPLPSRAHAKGSAGALETAEDIAQRAFSLKSSDEQMARAYLSLALHLDPFLGDQQAFRWINSFLSGERRQYWKGNVFVGLDKTYIEGLFSQNGLFSIPNNKALYAWRNLELSGLSCCGIDNVAVFFQQASRHMYLVPFVDLVPWYPQRLKPENLNMYNSFRQWWEENGRRPMPEPQVYHRGGGRFDWEVMKVSFRRKRIPAGWNDVIQAVLLYRLNEFEAAKTCVQLALRANAKLSHAVDELLPKLKHSTMALPVVPQELVAQKHKYIVCYNPHVGLGNLAVVMVSAHILAKLTGRAFLLHWNVNEASSHAFKLKEQPGVHLLKDVAHDIGVTQPKVKDLYFFHMMHSKDLGDMLELLGCSDYQAALESHPVVTVSSNLYFAPILATNPNTPAGAVPSFPELLKGLLAPSDRSAERALAYIRKSSWGQTAPVVAIHVRARESAEDNDDWPTASSPDAGLLEKMRKCVETAVARELPNVGEWDLFIASTTEKARSAVAKKLRNRTAGLRHVLTLPNLERSRRTDGGAADAMAEALLISRADVFVRLVVGTSGFSTFAYLSNALRAQDEWAAAVPGLERRKPLPNYIVTETCGPGRCYVAPPDVRMASIAWHGSKYTQRSCGDVVKRVERAGTEELGCRGLQDVDTLPKSTTVSTTRMVADSSSLPEDGAPAKKKDAPANAERKRLFSYTDVFSNLASKLFGNKDGEL